MMRAYCKGGHIVARDCVTDHGQGVTVDHHGQRVGVASGFQTAGGIILLDDRLTTSESSQELEVLASATPGLEPGQRVVVYIGGDDGSISATGISAFLSFDGQEAAIVPERFVWAVVRDGELIPRLDVLLVERDDAVMRRYAFNDSPIHPPDALLATGAAAANRDNPQESGARPRDSVTLQYARVVRAGPDVRDDQLGRGAVVAFSPSYMCTALVRLVRGLDGQYTRRYYALVSSAEIFFVVGE
jgi:hypothetical protein